MVGDPAVAEKEFRRAAEFGQPAAIVIPKIATALLENGEAAKVGEEFAGKKLEYPHADARLRVVVGLAQLRLRKGDEASASFAAALASDPDNLQAKLGQARIAAMTGHLDEAIS